MGRPVYGIAYDRPGRCAAGHNRRHLGVYVQNSNCVACTMIRNRRNHLKRKARKRAEAEAASMSLPLGW